MRARARPGWPTRELSHTHEFGTTTAGLMGLRDWLVAHAVTLCGVGAYWKPVYYALEDEIECCLLNARHLRNVLGRKTDVVGLTV